MSHNYCSRSRAASVVNVKDCPRIRTPTARRSIELHSCTHRGRRSRTTNYTRGAATVCEGAVICGCVFGRSYSNICRSRFICESDFIGVARTSGVRGISLYLYCAGRRPRRNSRGREGIRCGSSSCERTIIYIDAISDCCGRLNSRGSRLRKRARRTRRRAAAIYL